MRPGEVVWADSTTRITTLLGSCVAVCVWHPQLHVGGLAHGMLPQRLGPRGDRLDGRYLDEAFEILLGQMRSYGSTVGFQTKLFGGSAMLPSNGLPGMDIGQRNAQHAQTLVSAHGLLVASSDLGGNRFRKLAFHLDTGDVWLRRLSIPAATGSDSRVGNSASTVRGNL